MTAITRACGVVTGRLSARSIPATSRDLADGRRAMSFRHGRTLR
ncbi:hypothetical protein ACQQ2N_01265 [Dokdonella sp. MW10]